MAAGKSLRKDALRTDRIYFSPSGPIPISRKRAEHWVQQFKRMSAAGLVIPVPIEHQDDATPGNAKFLKSKLNFGTLDELTLDADGQLCFACTPRAGAVGTSTKFPKFVSPQIHDRYVDPSGKVWRDVLTHMALTNVPVNAGQSDKWQLIDTTKTGKLQRMSLKGTWRMASDDDKTPADDAPPFESESAAPETETPTTTEDELLRGVNTDDGTDKVFRTVLAGLAETCGMVLPEDTTADNFFDRAATALIAIQGQADQEPEQVGNEYDEESNFMGTGVSAMSTTVTPPKPVAKPVPGVTRLSAVELAFTRNQRQTLVTRLNALVESGRATPDEIDPRITEAGRYRLSLREDGELETSALDTWIESRETLPRGAVWPAVERMGLEPMENPLSEDKEEERSRATTVATMPISY